MPYELTVVANRQNPDGRGGRAKRKAPTVSTISLRGVLEEGAAEAVLSAIGDVVADSIVVAFDDVDIADDAGIERLVAGVMRFRSDGVNVQVLANSDECHARLANEARSRDWLLSRSAKETETPRKALHTDGNI